MKNWSNVTSVTYTAIKFLAILVTSTLILFINNWQVILFIFTLTILLTSIINAFKPNKNFYRILRSLLIVAVMIIAFNLLLSVLPNYFARFISGLIAAQKIVTLGLLVFVFTTTTSINNLISVLTFLPKKVQLVLTITLGIIPAIIDETSKIILVQHARGINFRGLNFVRHVFALVIPLLHRSFQRAEQMAIFLCTRGYEVD